MSRNFTLLYLLLVAIPFTLCAQPSIQWEKSYGGSNIDKAMQIQPTYDGGYVFVATTASSDADVTAQHGQTDYWVVKLNAAGNIQWQQCLGGSMDEAAAYIHQTADSGYIVSGYSKSADGDITVNIGGEDIWVAKLDKQGNMEWQKSIGGTTGDVSSSIKQTFDGGYILSGYGISNDVDISGNHGAADFYLIKLNDTGAIEWQRCYGGSGTEVAKAVKQTADSGYIICGHSSSFDQQLSINRGMEDVWIVKTNATGTILWKASIGGSGSDIANDICQTADGGYLAVGVSNSNNIEITGNHGFNDGLAIKLTANGAVSWVRCYGGSANDGFTSVQNTFNGSYIVAGSSGSADGDVIMNYGSMDYWAVKLGITGNIDWQLSLGGDDPDGCSSISQTADSGYILAGLAGINTGLVTVNHGFSDCWVVKLSPAPNNVAMINDDAAPVSLYPTVTRNEIFVDVPANKKATVKIYDITGREVYTGNMKGMHESISLSGYASGSYLVKVLCDERVWDFKVVYAP